MSLKCTDRLERDRLILFLYKLILHKVSYTISLFALHANLTHRFVFSVH